jgi:hypothetical protein
MLAPWTCFCPPPKKPGTRQESLIYIAVRKVAHPGDCKADLPRDPYLHYANTNGNVMSVLRKTVDVDGPGYIISVMPG